MNQLVQNLSAAYFAFGFGILVAESGLLATYLSPIVVAVVSLLLGILFTVLSVTRFAIS